MANPQIEDGYTKIANELLNALSSTNLEGSQFMICLAVISKTYGWNKKQDQISITQFQKLTKMSRQRIIKAIDRLVLYSILGSIVGNTTKSSTYWIIKDYDKWNVPSIAGNPSIGRNTRGGIVGDKKVVLDAIPTQYNNKRQLNKPAFDFELLWQKYPRKMGKEDSLRHFRTQVKNEEDYANINKALENFINSDVLKGDPKFIPHGSTWFNKRWKDWVNYIAPISDHPKVLEGF